MFGLLPPRQSTNRRTFRRIAVYSDSDPISQNLRYDLGGLDCLFSRFLKNVRLQRAGYINVYLTSIWEKDGKIENTVVNFADCYVYFDQGFFDQLESNYAKKKYFLGELLRILLITCEAFAWDKLPFLNAYDACLKQNLAYDWFLGNKLYRSPDRQYYAGIYHLVDIGKYQINEILFDRRKNELARRLCYVAGPSFYVKWGCWEGQSETFHYRFNGPAKPFSFQVRDLLEGKQLVLTPNSSKFFKST